MATRLINEADVIESLQDLLELEYDSVEAYIAAINRLDNKNFQAKMTEFKNDHEHRISEIKSLLEKYGAEFKAGPSGKQMLAIGKIAISSIFGDEKILSAMSMVEDDAIKAYKENLQENLKAYPEVKAIFKDALKDEKRHNSWIAETVR